MKKAPMTTEEGAAYTAGWRERLTDQPCPPPAPAMHPGEQRVRGWLECDRAIRSGRDVFWVLDSLEVDTMRP